MTAHGFIYQPPEKLTANKHRCPVVQHAKKSSEGRDSLLTCPRGLNERVGRDPRSRIPGSTAGRAFRALDGLQMQTLLVFVIFCISSGSSRDVDGLEVEALPIPKERKHNVIKKCQVRDLSSNLQQDVKGDHHFIKEEFHSHQLSIIKLDFWIVATIPLDKEKSFLLACGGSENRALGMQA